MDDLVALESGCCPDCGKPIHWNSKAWPIGFLEMEDVIQEVIGGYYRLKPFPIAPVLETKACWYAQ